MDTTAPGRVVSAVEKSAVRKILIRIVPFVALMFFINYLDRVAISFAGPNGLNDDLSLTAAQFGFASGIFSLGYILLEVPSNIALNRFGARRWLARIMVSWGIVALLLAFVQNFEQLAGLRFLLGVAEAGFFPGAVLFLSRWAPPQHRNKVLALFYVAQPLTNVLGGPLAGQLIQAHGLFGLEGWRVMFIGVAIPAIVVGIIAWFYLRDKPSDAKWLTRDEQQWLEASLAAEKSAVDDHSTVRPRLWDAFKSGRVWVLAFVYFGITYGFYVVAYFLPTIIAGFQETYGFATNPLQQGVISGAVYLPAAIVLLLWARDAAKRGVRLWHVGAPILLGVVGNIGALLAGSPVVALVFVALVPIAIFAANPNFWTLPSRFLTGAAAAVGFALINTVGNIAGFVAPLVTGALADATGAYQIPLLIPGILMLLAAILVGLLGRADRLKNVGLRAAQSAGDEVLEKS
ncbi:MFS transporter [Protaetiibacter larvae]|nr:MFS transporter [Protaetiibacter larvae]